MELLIDSSSEDHELCREVVVPKYRLQFSIAAKRSKKYYSKLADPIQFRQKMLVADLAKQNYPKLEAVAKKYGGLCEIICNYLTINDYLGKKREVNFYKTLITLDALNILKDSHIMENSGILSKLRAFVSNKYKFNLFATSKNFIVGNKPFQKLHKDSFEKHIAKLQENTYLKTMLTRKKNFKFAGHVILIKKITNENYALFDPNAGEYINLTPQALCQKVSEIFKTYSCDSIFFINNKKYLNSLLENNSNTTKLN